LEDEDLGAACLCIFIIIQGIGKRKVDEAITKPKTKNHEAN